MTAQNVFNIKNGMQIPLEIHIEPEAVIITLQENESVAVYDAFTMEPATVSVEKESKSHLVLSVWPGDGNVSVRKNGVDVFEN